jgi:hypothetical protein
MQQRQNGSHPAMIININEEFKIHEDLTFAEEVGESLLRELDRFGRRVFYNCPNCGGLLPEIVFKDVRGKSYCFALVEIRNEDDGTIAETNYRLLEFYLRKEREKNDL